MEKLEKYVLFSSLFTTFSAIFILKTLSLCAPTIGSEFLMDNVSQNWMVAICSIFISAFTIPAGQICSKYGCKKMFIVGCGVFIFGLILSVISVSSQMFIVSRAITGIGYALYFVAEMAIIVLAIDRENQGRAFGIVYVGPYLALILGPSVGGYLITHFGWRSVFYIAIPLMMLCTLIMFLKVDEEWISNKEGKIDSSGCLLYVIGIVLFVYGFSNLQTLTGQIVAVIGVVVLILFGIYESKIELPVFDINLFKNKTFAAYNLVGFFEFFAITVFDVIFSYYLQYAKGWDPQLTGLILIIPPIILAIMTPNAGKLSDKIHPQKLSTIGLGILLVPLIGLIFIGVNTSIYLVVAAMALIAIGTGIFSVPNTKAVMASISEEHAPYASATQTTLRSCGQTLSLGLLTLICSFVMGNLPLSTEFAGLFVDSLNIIALICTVLCAIAIAFSIWGIKSESPNKT